MNCSKFKSKSESELNINNSMIQGSASSPKMWSTRRLLNASAPSWPLSLQVGCQATQTYCNTHSTYVSLHTIKFTSKAWASKAQQDLPVNVAINSRLLVCKAYRVNPISVHKPALIVVPYFHVLALSYTKFKLYLPSWTKSTKRAKLKWHRSSFVTFLSHLSFVTFMLLKFEVMS
jgi:hypothetical protein